MEFHYTRGIEEHIFDDTTRSPRQLRCQVLLRQRHRGGIVVRLSSVTRKSGCKNF